MEGNAQYVSKGIKRGLTLENALKYVPKGKEKYTVRGISGTFSELCEYFKPEVSTQTIRDRIKRGMSMEEAMFLPPSVPGRPKKKDKNKFLTRRKACAILCIT